MQSLVNGENSRAKVQNVRGDSSAARQNEPAGPLPREAPEAKQRQCSQDAFRCEDTWSGQRCSEESIAL
jgi:hypothetical protein